MLIQQSPHRLTKSLNSTGTVASVLLQYKQAQILVYDIFKSSMKTGNDSLCKGTVKKVFELMIWGNSVCLH
jgi:hypothetical protein